MRKRLFILALCLCLLLTATPLGVYADSTVSFISINDTLPPELINCFTYYGGAVYVPAWIFASYGFGIYYSYAVDTNTATLYTGSSELIFELSTGLTYDGDGNYYTLSGIMRGGSVYVPLSYIASYFGTFTYSTIKTQYGTVLRIKDGRVWLTDSEFLKPAMNLLKQYYNAYNKEEEKQENVNDSPAPETGYEHEGTNVLIAFVGLPGDENLDTLEEYGLRGCFFLTAEQVRSEPDRVRRLACQGHMLGVLWDGESYDETAELIFESARVRTIMVAALEENAEDCAALAQEKSLVYFDHSIEAAYGPEEGKSPYIVTSAIELAAGEEGIALLLNCVEGMEETLTIVLGYLHSNKFEVFAPSEILY